MKPKFPMRMPRSLVTSASVAVAMLSLSVAGFDRAAFETPDNVFSPSFFWMWNGRLDPSRLCADMDDMYAHNARSVCIHPFPKDFRPGMQPSDMEPDYLTEEYFRVYGEVLDRAAEKGVVSWLYDEGGWPSGSACGKVMASDPERFAPSLMMPGGKIQRLYGNPKITAPYPSLIEKGVTETFLRMTHDEYARHIGRHFGKTIRFAFTDEPAFPGRYRGKCLSWCSDFQSEFRSRKGYDIMPYVDELASMTNRDDSIARVRVDYRDVLSQLFQERYLLPLRDWCHDHGIGSGGHFGGDDEFTGNALHCYGHILRALRALDVPGVDVIWRQLWPGKEGRQAPFPKYASSAAHQNGTRHVLAEACAIYGDGMRPAQIQWLVNYLLVRGCNMFVFSSYSPRPRRAGMAGAGPHFGAADPQWDCMAELFRRVGRYSALLSQGNPVQKTAVFYDVRAAWTQGADADAADRRHYDVSRELLETQRDFDYVDDDQLSDAVIVPDGPALAIGKMKYECIVLPTSKWMRKEARARLYAFRKAGGKVVEGDDFSAVPAVCRITGPGARDIRVMKRESNGKALYFFANESMEERTVKIAIDEKAPLVSADPDTGAWVPLESQNGVFTWNAAPGGGIAVLSGVEPSVPAPPRYAGKTIVLDGTWEMAVRRRIRPGQEEYVVEDTPAAPFALGRLGDWRPMFGDEFSGRIAYRTTFESPAAGAALLDLGKVFNCCSVKINGKDAGFAYAPPHRLRLDVKGGTNTLEVTVANSLVNALASKPFRQYIWKRFPPKSPYEGRVEKFIVNGHESGLYGPVSLTLLSAGAPAWPAVTREMRPWCYNWWMGSAVDVKGLEAQADALSKAGFGGFHVIPIYGAKGWEPKYREFLSESWMSAFADAVRIGASRDLGVDLTMGSGWCFGGPQLAPEDGCWRLFTTAEDKDVKPGMKVLWTGTDAEGRKRMLVAALTGQQVKRAGLGGKGPMMDPYSTAAMDRFLAPYTAAFDRPGAVKPEHLYHDSFEYFRSAWTPGIYDAFKAKRGYDLRDHLAELAGVGSDEAVARIKCDYRETLSDLIIEDVFPRWFDWCRKRGIATRNEAHGAPANWLDFYALADIPETEMFGDDCRDVLVSKFASSAAHVTGKPMVSSESCTWLGQHFTETLADAKVFLDRLFLSGVNHMFYHGCCYSPVEAPWPGWCFYASAQMNPRNTIWRDTDALSAYITRCQSVFRAYEPDNDVLVYWPLRDYWMDKDGMELQMSVHNANKWFNSQPVGQTAQKLYDAGYAFDYISDRLLMNLKPGTGSYKTVVVPPCRYMPEKTKARLAELAAAGMKVVWNGGMPVAARREPFAADAGLMYARYRKDGATVYFIVNTGTARVKRGFRPASVCTSAWTMDPMTGRIAALPVSGGELPLDIRPGHSTILYVSADAAPCAAAPAPSTVGKPFEVKGEWTLAPVTGGPDPLPAVRKMSRLSGWERLDDGAENPFCGTMRYSIVFDAPRTDATVLDLGDVRQSAKVTLNGRDLGKVFMAPFRVTVPQGVLKPAANLLEIEVTSVAANRIRKMDRDGTQWRIFHDINFASYMGKGKFDASNWPLTVNGLLGPVVFDPEVDR